MRSLWHLGGLTWPQLVMRVGRQSMRDELIGRAAELGYFFLFSVFPLLLFLTTLLGYVARGSWQLRSQLFQWVSRVSPSADIVDLLRSTIEGITTARGGAKLSFGLVAAIWVASNGMIAVGRTLNTACGLRESRPWWWRRLTSIGLVTAFALGTILALVVIFFGETISLEVAAALDLGGGFAWIWRVTQWSLVLCFVVVAFDLIYNYAPNLAADHHVWFTPGAFIGVGLWIATSYGMRVYIANFPYYSMAYGSLGVVIVLLLWFYLTAAALLIGGEINSEIAVAVQGEAAERAARSRTPRGRREAAAEGGATGDPAARPPDASPGESRAG
jgi:membrane protein